MQTAVFTQPVAKTPHAVWGFLADLRNDAVWRQEVIEVTLVSGTARQPQARYREQVRWKQFQAEVELTIVDASEPSRLVVSTEGAAYRSRSLWTFDPVDHGTLVTLVFSMETTGAMHLAEGLITEMISRWLERDLPLLQGHLESLSD